MKSLLDSERFRASCERERQAQAVRSRNWARLHPDGIKAHGLVWQALKSGKLKRADCCEVCGGGNGYLKAHHEDYSKPLAVTWLCGPCHKTLHLRRAVAGHNSPMSTTEFMTVLASPDSPMGQYTITRYGKPWRVVMVSAAGESPPVNALGPALAGILPVQVAGRPCRVDDKTAALLARPVPGPAQPDPGPAESEPMTRRHWRTMSDNARKYWLRIQQPGIESEDDLADWLAELPA